MRVTEAQEWLKVAELLDSYPIPIGICKALFLSPSLGRLHEKMQRRLNLHREAHAVDWAGMYVYEGVADVLPQNRGARVLACLWLANEAAEETNEDV